MTMSLIYPYFSGSDDATNHYWFGNYTLGRLDSGATGTFIRPYRYDNGVDNSVFHIYAVVRDENRDIDSITDRDISDSATEDATQFRVISKIDDDRFLYCYTEAGSSGNDRWRIHNFRTNTTGSYTEQTTIGDGAYRGVPVGDGTHVLILYADASTLDLDARVVTTSGTSAPTVSGVTHISGYEIVTGTFKVVAMGNSRFVVIWNRSSNSDLVACLISVSGTTVTVEDTTTIMASHFADAMDVCRMSETTGAVAWNYVTDIDLWRFSSEGDTLSFSSRQASFHSGYLINIEQYSDASCLLCYKTGVSSSPTIEELEDTGSSLSSLTSDTHSSTYSQAGVVYMGDGDGFYAGMAAGSPGQRTHVTAYDPSPPGPAASASGVYAIALSNDIENDGTKGFLTLWRDSVLYLQKWDLPTLTVDFEIPLGSATLDEVQARTRTAYPFALSDQEVFIYGAMDSPAYLSGVMQLIQTTTGGGSGTWSDQSPGTWDSSHILAGFFAGVDSGGGRPWYGVRCTTGTAPAFWYGTAALSYESVTPLLDGTIIRHGAFHISKRESAVIGADYGTGSTVYVADPPLWATWQDFTYDHPSGSHGVLRFL